MPNFDPVVFNEGEPLDVNKLNAIQQNTSLVYRQTSQIYNATVGDGSSTQTAPYIPIVNAGYVGQTTQYTADTLATYDLDFGGTALFPTTPFVTATFRSGIVKDEIVFVSVINFGVKS